jgi:rSAM/selenodomain-associated transferase 1
LTIPRHRRHLLVFARNPMPGRVKTRLIPALGVESATAVYRRMLRDTLAACSQVEADRRELWLDQADPDAGLTAMLERYDMSLHVQSGPDLGVRMHNAFVASLKTADTAILIGTDCPEYDPPYLEAAFRALGQQDAVLGPAADGGYVLIGLRKAETSLFRDIPWGTEGVLAATRRQLQRLQWKWSELRVLHDVDQPADLDRFPHLDLDLLE